MLHFANYRSVFCEIQIPSSSRPTALFIAAHATKVRIFSEYTVLRYLINCMDNIIFPENSKTPCENASFLKLQICILRNEDCSFRFV